MSGRLRHVPFQVLLIESMLRHATRMRYGKWSSRVQQNRQVGPPGQGPGSEASTFRENTDTQFGKKPVVTSAHPPALDIRSD